MGWELTPCQAPCSPRAGTWDPFTNGSMRTRSRKRTHGPWVAQSRCPVHTDLPLGLCSRAALPRHGQSCPTQAPGPSSQSLNVPGGQRKDRKDGGKRHCALPRPLEPAGGADQGPTGTAAELSRREATLPSTTAPARFLLTTRQDFPRCGLPSSPLQSRGGLDCRW